MIDVLFTLHVRRFGFKYVTFLQTYTMYVACTVNVPDFKETTAMSGSSVEQQGEKRRRVAEEASARLDFGLEVLRQAGSTPSAARCAAIISRLLRKSNDGETPSNTRSNHQPASDVPPISSAGIAGHDMNNTQVSFNMRSPDAVADGQSQAVNTAYGSDRRLSHQSSNPQTQHELAHSAYFQQESTARRLSVEQGHVPQLASMEYKPSPIESRWQMRGEDLNRLGDQNETGVIETPLRWLGENMHDDGSWMLMVDGDPYGFMGNYQP